MRKKLLAITFLSVFLACSLLVSFIFFDGFKGASNNNLIQRIGDEAFVKGATLFETDFSEFTEDSSLPDGFKVGSPAFDYDSNADISAGIHSEKGKNLLSFSVLNGSGYLELAKINTQNYIFEADVLIDTDNNASLGIVNDMQGGIDSAHGAVICSIRLNENKSIWSYYSVAEEDWESIDADSLGHPLSNPKKNEVVKLKLISYNNFNYVYINSVLIATFAQPYRDFSFDNVGLLLSDGEIKVKRIKVTAALNPDFAVTDTLLGIDDKSNTAFITVTAKVNKDNDVYKMFYSDEYSLNNKAKLKFGLIVAENNIDDLLSITIDTKNIKNIALKEFTQDTTNVSFSYCIENIPKDMLNKFYTVRAYAIIDGEYLYSDAVSFTPLRLANDTYLNSKDDQKELIKKVFSDVKGFNSTGYKSITFGLFSDFHYKEGVYVSSIADMNYIFERAYLNNASFVISAGDITNDMKGSPELVNAFKNNKYGLDAYNVYGNHELEWYNNTMQVVTPTLTNDASAVWGTEDGKIGNGDIGYYYVDREGFRLVFLDTNYYFDESDSSWKHNPEAYWGAPDGATKIQSLSPAQLEWLENVLTDAANKDIPCIVTAHHSFSSKMELKSSDGEKVRNIYKKVNAIQPGTVIMSINGHIHTNSHAFEDGVFFFDMNTTRNLWWQPTAEKHYTEEHTYQKEVYDANGQLLEIVETPLNSELCWYSDAPLSAIVTVYENGVIEIDGSSADWLYGIAPTNKSPNSVPFVTSGTFKIE